MDNLWILTEERPKESVIKKIIDIYSDVFGDRIVHAGSIKIKPSITNGVFDFLYIVENITLQNVEGVYIKTASGSLSFVDFLVFKGVAAPLNQDMNVQPLMAVEETKTRDKDSRNTGVYQRGSKFAYFRHVYPNVPMYMLYNDEGEDQRNKKPSDTSIFGTRMLLTLGVEIIGKDKSEWFLPFDSLESLIVAKANMRKAPAGNVPLTITRYNDRIELSARLAKPADKGNIGHDPNMGYVSTVSACLRKLGWQGEIVVTNHGVSQEYIDKLLKRNKLLCMCVIYNIKLRGIDFSRLPQFNEPYWHYEVNSEKMVDILLHVQVAYYGGICLYENHAKCERGYFRSATGELLSLPKKDSHGENLNIPDVVLYDSSTHVIIVIESKRLNKLRVGLEQVQDYDSIVQEYIIPNYPDACIQRWLSIFGGERQIISHNEVLIYLSDDGHILINSSAPYFVKRCFALDENNV